MRGMANTSSHRRKANRCESMLCEYGTAKAREHKRRTWQCQLVVGHPGKHQSYSGHRTWTDEQALGGEGLLSA